MAHLCYRKGQGCSKRHSQTEIVTIGYNWWGGFQNVSNIWAFIHISYIKCLFLWSELLVGQTPGITESCQSFSWWKTSEVWRWQDPAQRGRSQESQRAFLFMVLASILPSVSPRPVIFWVVKPFKTAGLFTFNYLILLATFYKYVFSPSKNPGWVNFRPMNMHILCKKEILYPLSQATKLLFQKTQEACRFSLRQRHSWNWVSW